MNWIRGARKSTGVLPLKKDIAVQARQADEIEVAKFLSKTDIQEREINWSNFMSVV